MPTRSQRRTYRQQIVAAIQQSEDWRLIEEQTIARNQSRYFCCSVEYAGRLARAANLRPHLQLEMSFAPTILPTEQRPLQSFVGQARGAEPEVASMPCFKIQIVAAITTISRHRFTVSLPR